MFRKRPPQLSVLEELESTYADVCNYSIQNLTHEENGDVVAALKGWKSLHTSVLFKLEMFERMKLGEDEQKIVDQLKKIRDENVKHLIRAQLRVDESNRRASVSSGEDRAPPPVPPKRAGNTSASSFGHSQAFYDGPVQPPGDTGPKVAPYTPAIAVEPPTEYTSPQLTNREPAAGHGHHGHHLYQALQQPANTSGKHALKQTVRKGLMRSLRPTQSSSSVPKAPHVKSNSASVAATKSWSSKPRFSDPFGDFDQNEYEEKESVESVSLIDLDTELAASTDELSLKPRLDALKPYKSSTDIHESSPSPPPQPKPYIYNKPKPLNVQQIMARTTAQRHLKENPPSAALKAAKLTTAKPRTTAAARSAPAAQKPTAPKKNIQYNYVKPKPNGARPNGAPKPKQPPKKPVAKKQEPLTPPTKHPEEFDDPASPTMDDLLESYDDDDYSTPKSQEKLLATIKGIDMASGKSILNDIVVHGDEVYWDDIVGLEGAKNSLKEAVVYPFLRPDLFRGLREPTRGMLLFGPPGTGKTMLARAVATESKSTFFSINPSSLTSKYLGESEKLVRALFMLAKRLAPSIVFIDEIDSLLSSRGDGENEASRRIKNEFLVQWSELSAAAAGRDTSEGDVSRVLILGATNLPWSIDEAARRRFVRRQYIPLPEPETRVSQIKKLLAYQKHTLSEEDFAELEKLTAGFSGSDITALAKDSAMGPLRSLGELLLSTPTEQIRPINLDDFKQSLQYIKPSVGQESLKEYQEWAAKFGSSGN
ncbi:hypothetical protein DICA3_E10638 [Diutina catenulata]